MSNSRLAAPRNGLITREKNTMRLRMVIAVDFGTTFSAIAYANTNEAHKQTVLDTWGLGCPSADKTPTVLRYDNGGTTGPFVWGFEANKLQPGERSHQWFKLQLCPEYEQRRAAESELLRQYPNKTALAHVSPQDAEKLVVDYLSSLKERIDKHLASFDKLVRDLPREYIVTVPAIWDHKEQEKTRKCAHRAGMGNGNRLQVISEPEAAAIYALDTMPRIGLKKDDTFVICDAGGGTVDLASYSIQSFDPITLDGAAKGSGGLCGSSFLNRIFAAYFQRKFQRHIPGYDEGLLNYVLDEFETRIKPGFTGRDTDTYRIMMPGLEDNPQHGIRKGCLEFSGKELREHVFKKVIEKVQGLVRDQISNTSKPVKAVLLAGGFGRSEYLKDQLTKIPLVQRHNIPVQQIDNSNTAIVRGALIAGLTRHDTNPDQDGSFRVPLPRVRSRIAGRSYGTRAYQYFDPSQDDKSKRTRQDGGEYLVERMQWFIKEGDSIRDRDAKSFEFEKEYEVSKGPIEDINVHIYSCEKRDTNGNSEPKYWDDKGVRECAVFKMNLKDLSIPTEERNGVLCYIARFVIEVFVDSASLTFRGIYAKGTDKEKKFDRQHVEFV